MAGSRSGHKHARKRVQGLWVSGISVALLLSMGLGGSALPVLNVSLQADQGVVLTQVSEGQVCSTSAATECAEIQWYPAGPLDVGEQTAGPLVTLANDGRLPGWLRVRPGRCAPTDEGDEALCRDLKVSATCGSGEEQVMTLAALSLHDFHARHGSRPLPVVRLAGGESVDCRFSVRMSPTSSRSASRTVGQSLTWSLSADR